MDEAPVGNHPPLEVASSGDPNSESSTSPTDVESLDDDEDSQPADPATINRHLVHGDPAQKQRPSQVPRPAQTPAAPVEDTVPLGLIALISGGISLLAVWAHPIAWIAAIIAIVVGSIAINRGPRDDADKTMAILGIVAGSITLLLALFFLYFFWLFFETTYYGGSSGGDSCTGNCGGSSGGGGGGSSGGGADFDAGTSVDASSLPIIGGLITILGLALIARRKL